MTQPPSDTHPDTPPPRVLLSAFACDPTMGSEPYVGYQWARTIAEAGVQVHVLTRRHHQANLTQALYPGITCHYLEFPGFRAFGHRSRGIRLYYLIWQVAALFRAWRLTRLHSIKAVHHVTYNTIEFPGLLWLLPGVHFAWGPVGGGQFSPKGFRNIYTNAAWLRERARFIVKTISCRLPIVKLAVKQAKIVWAANEETRQLLLMASDRPVGIELETAIHDACGELPAPAASPVRFVWIGHGDYRKAPQIAVDAYRRAGFDPEVATLTFVGDGPAIVTAERQAAGVSGIQFVGALPHKDIGEAIRASDVLLFTSVQDTSGNVILESLSAGVPVIAMNHQGAKQILQEGGGVLLPSHDYQSAVRHFSATMTRLVEESDQLHELQKEACSASQAWTWDGKWERIKVRYLEFLAEAAASGRG